MTACADVCPDAGRWRAWLDTRASDERTELTDHLVACADCQGIVAETRLNARVAADALTLLAPRELPTAADTIAARLRLPVVGAGATLPSPVGASDGRATTPPYTPTIGRIGRSTPRLLRRTPWQTAGAAVAALLVVGVVAFTPGGHTAAAAFLAQFRSQQLAVIEVSPQSQQDIQRTLEALSNFGTVSTADGALPSRGERQNLPSVSLSEASQRVGFAITEPDPNALPPGVNRTPTIQVMPGTVIRFTFDRAKALAYYQSQGKNVNIAPRFDHATLVAELPTAALLTYSSTDSNSRQELVVGESGELTIGTEGNVTLGEMRDFLLGLPGLPADTVNQLRAIDDWQNTLPVPLPTDQVQWQRMQIQGQSGLVVNDNSGIGSAAIVQSGGHIYGWAGSLKATALLNVANHTAFAH
ncbi:MAG: hypothetical protein JO023_09320 [Chloroflexi bacterium]|nr:hypothetical protein [Chloroflexota bacterium]